MDPAKQAQLAALIMQDVQQLRERAERECSGSRACSSPPCLRAHTAS